ncbi:hypothetical protein [Rhodococcus koreensis]
MTLDTGHLPGPLMITRHQVEELHQVERDLTTDPTPEQLAKDLAIVHAILTTVECVPHMSTMDLLAAADAGDLTTDAVIDLYQSIITDGSVWHMDPHRQHLAQALIEAGYCYRVP